MRVAKVLALAGVMTMGGAATALADGHNTILVHPYKAANYCPAGLQPVTVGGVICCGTPNTSAHYVDRPGGKRHYRKVAKRHQSKYYAVEGEKGVRMR